MSDATLPALSRWGRTSSGVRSLIVAALACAWISLEGWWRGEALVASLDTTTTIAVAAATFVASIAARMRMTARGERVIAGELAALMLAASALPLALLFAAYVVACLLSIASVVAGWTLILVVVLLAGIVHLTAWLGFLLGVAGAEESPAFILVWGAIWYLILAALGAWAFDDAHAMWTFAMCRVVLRLRTELPPWSWALAELRALVAGVSLVRLEAHQLAVATGMLVALPVTVALRWGRRLLAAAPRLRVYLPMSSAPLPDGAPLISPALRAPATWLAALMCGALLAWRT